MSAAELSERFLDTGKLKRTFQYVHPDQLGALRATPDLPLQVILGLHAQVPGTKNKTNKNRMRYIVRNKVFPVNAHNRSAVTLSVLLTCGLRLTAVAAGVSAADILVLSVQQPGLFDKSATSSL